jgi:arylsulfatase
MLAVGALLGYAAASGKIINPLAQSRVTAGTEEQAAQTPGDPSNAETPRTACCCDGVDKGQLVALANRNAAVAARAEGNGKKPNILVIFGDDIGQSNISAYTHGLMGYHTPNIDRIAKEGMIFTDYYAEQSCTAGRSSFITGQCTFRTGLSKVGIPASPIGLQARDVTIAQLLKPLGYATGQFGKNHLGDKNEYLPTVHGFDEFFGNLYHLNAEEEPEQRTYPRDPKFRERFGPRGVLAARPRTRTTRPNSRAGGASASRPSRTPARSPRSGWNTSTTIRPMLPSSTCGVRSRPASRSFAG